MLLRHTFIFVPSGTANVIKLEIYTVKELAEPGFWNIDNNKVLLSDYGYSEFRSLKEQSKQKKFFDQLKKISNVQLAT